MRKIFKNKIFLITILIIFIIVGVLLLQYFNNNPKAQVYNIIDQNKKITSGNITIKRDFKTGMQEKKYNMTVNMVDKKNAKIVYETTANNKNNNTNVYILNDKVYSEQENKFYEIDGDNTKIDLSSEIYLRPLSDILKFKGVKINKLNSKSYEVIYENDDLENAQSFDNEQINILIKALASVNIKINLLLKDDGSLKEVNSEYILINNAGQKATFKIDVDYSEFGKELQFSTKQKEELDKKVKNATDLTTEHAE